MKDGWETRTTLSNATLQQHLTVVRLFHDFLVEENICTRNPLRPAVGGRSLIQRHHRLPWIPSEEQWQGILQVCKRESLRNRLMLAMSYDAALRREEICSLETTDIDPAHRLLRIRLEATKGRRERIVPYSVPTSEIFGRYLSERRNGVANAVRCSCPSRIGIRGNRYRSGLGPKQSCVYPDGSCHSLLRIRCDICV